jgi:hypothetical protein
VFCFFSSVVLNLIGFNLINISNTIIIIILWILTLFYYQYVQCAVSVIYVVAVDLAH